MIVVVLWERQKFLESRDGNLKSDKYIVIPSKAKVRVQGNLLEETEEVVDVWQEEGGVRLQEQLNIFVRDIALVQTHLKKVNNHRRQDGC